MQRILRDRQRGVALLEVLLTVSVLAFGLGATLQAISTCTRTQSRLGRQHMARLLAERQLAALRMLGGQALQGDMGGEFPVPNDEYSWSAHSTPPTEEAPFTVLEIMIWKGRDSQRSQVYTLQTIMSSM